MATTDARTGFRLPWSSEQRPANETDGAAHTEASAEAPATGSGVDWPASDSQPVEGQPAMTAEMAPSPTVEATEDPGHGSKKPSKFLADLTKAMQTAAEEARGRTLSQFQADAKAHIEGIHGRSATEAAGLRKTADDDVAAVREWSKTEIARIREDSEQRITDRKSRLEREVEEHAALIEREIEHVQGQVNAFEAEMAGFFERLMAEEDPTRFATMAETLPEPPPFVDLTPEALAALPPLASEVEVEVDETAETEGLAEATADEMTEATADAVVEDATVDDARVEDAVETETVGETETVVAETETMDGAVETAAESTDDGGWSGEAMVADGSFDGETGDGEFDREAAFAAIQAAAEAAASAEIATDAATRAEDIAEVAIQIVGSHEGEPEADPRVAALGLSPDFDLAEVEALNGSDGEQIGEISDNDLATRLASLVPSGSASGESRSTQVVVVGLVSVASIASFKRHLGRVAGVQSVGVSSGPEGEFVFAVNHAGDANLRDAIPTLPSFQARVTGGGEGTLNVTAHDPESSD
jgi:hypothetical protein